MLRFLHGPSLAVTRSSASGAPGAPRTLESVARVGVPVFAAFVVVSGVIVVGVVGFVVVTLRGDSRAARARDERTEAWLAEMTSRFDLEDAANERAAEALMAARHRAEPRRFRRS